MPATGPATAEIYVLGEAPGQEEDEQGKQFVGKSGKLLRRALPNRLEKTIRFDNVIDCRPPGNRQPTPLEVACCRQRQVADIEKVKPKLILAFGGVPLHWFTGEDKITLWRGRLIPVRVGKHTCWLAPIYHPSYVARSQHQAKGQLVEEAFSLDLKNALDAYDRGLPEPHVEDPANKDVGVQCLLDYAKVTEALARAQRWEDFAIDIETNGLRPYRQDPKILSVSISNYECTFSWPMQHREAPWSKAQLGHICDALVALLRKRTPIAHNSKMEQEWLSYFYGDAIVFEADWQDTMAQAYVLDEREGTKSLEHCTISRLGFNVKALSHVNPAHLEHEPLARVLSYNAYDAKYTYLLYYVQQELIVKEGMLESYRMANSRAGPLAIAQRRGVVPNPTAIIKLSNEYQRKQRDKELEIQNDPDVRRFVKEQGRQFNPASNKDLPALFHKQLKCKECEVKDKKARDKVRISTDEAVLSQIDRPIARHVLELRGIKKAYSTYIRPLTPDGGMIWPDKLVHADFHHLLTTTSRLSCSNPNLQNFPMRSAEARRIRSVIRAMDDWMLSFDFGQIEARVIGMASRDEFLVDALWTGYDIHMEWAEKLASDYPQVIGGKRFLKDRQAMKDFRSVVKNAWVFPLFFGSAMKSVAENLKMPISKVSPRYDEFWETFDGVRAWQEWLQKEYRRVGYVAKLTGGRRHAPLGLNEIINTPIQGTAADIVNDAFCRLSRRAFEEQMPHLQPVLQIHDDLTFYVRDADLESALDTIAREMVRTDTMDFINVPLTVEVSVGPDWSSKEEIAKFSSVDFGHRRTRE